MASDHDTFMNKCALCYFSEVTCSSNCFFKPYFPAGRLEELINVHKAYSLPKVFEWLIGLTPTDRQVSLQKIIKVANSYSHVEALKKVVRLLPEEKHEITKLLVELNNEHKIIIDDEDTVSTDSLFQVLDNPPRADNGHHIFGKAQLEGFKEAFSAYAVEGAYILVQNIMPLMNDIGETVDEKELHDLMTVLLNSKKISITPENSINFSAFLEIITEKYMRLDSESENELVGDFKAYDVEETGLISKDHTKIIMKSLSSTITDEELEEMLGQVFEASEQVSYEMLAKLMHPKKN